VAINRSTSLARCAGVNCKAAASSCFYSFRFFRHYSLNSDSPNNSKRTSSQGINSTVPASISTKRRSISADHAASTSGFDIGSNVAFSGERK
jgi:hypothetical protein